MSSIQKRSNSRWAVRWRDQEDRQRWKTFGTRAEAVEHRKRVDYELLTGGGDDPPQPTHLTLAEFYEDWLAQQVWRPSTVDQVRSHYRRHILPVFGDRILNEIEPAELQRWVRGLCDNLAPSSVHVVAAHLRRLLNDATDARHIEQSPVRSLRLPKVPRSLVVPPTTGQIKTLVLGIDDRYRRLIQVAASTGMRQGELFGLTIDRVDDRRRQIQVDRQLVSAGGTLRLGPPKTPASTRVIPVPQEVISVICDQVSSFGTGPDGLVFTNHDGAPINRTRFSDRWRPAARTAGLPAGQGMHCLRHFYASLLIRESCSVKVVQARLGHATAAETLDTYAHLWADDDDRTRDAVSRGVPSFRPPEGGQPGYTSGSDGHQPFAAVDGPGDPQSFS